jgi:hypothetical protein
VLETLMHMGAFGLGAIRCRPDPSYGEIVGHFPVDENGRMRIKDAEQFAGEAYAGAGGHGFDTAPLREGRLALDPLSPFNLLPPPGVANERDFPCLHVERPVAIASLRMIYGAAKTQNLKEEAMRSIDMIGVREDSQVATGGAYSGMLKGHVKL